MKKEGQVTLDIKSIFLNLSLTKYYAIRPATFLTTARMLVYADINKSAPGFNLLASHVAGPDPIDLPNTIISLGLHPIF